MKHTKGPWYLDKFGNLKSDSSNSTMNMVPFYGVCINGSDEAKANSALIAAAPEMLEALQKVRQDINWMLNEKKHLNEFVFDYIDAAIAKAEGL